MSDISRATKSKRAEISKLQAEVEALRRAASIMGGKTRATAKPQRQRRKMSAAAKKALSKRMKAYWAKKKRARK